MLAVNPGTGVATQRGIRLAGLPPNAARSRLAGER